MLIVSWKRSQMVNFALLTLSSLRPAHAFIWASGITVKYRYYKTAVLLFSANTLSYLANLILLLYCRWKHKGFELWLAEKWLSRNWKRMQNRTKEALFFENNKCSRFSGNGQWHSSLLLVMVTIMMMTTMVDTIMATTTVDNVMLVITMTMDVISSSSQQAKLSSVWFHIWSRVPLCLSRLTDQEGVLGFVIYGDLQIPLWQLPRPQSLSCNKKTVGRGKVWGGRVWLVQDILS